MLEHFTQGTAYSAYQDRDEIAWRNGIKELEDAGFRRTQRPHCKLPDIMTYWGELLKKSGGEIVWLSLRVKGRKTVIRAVAGSHPVGVGGRGYENFFVIRIFGDWEIKHYVADPDPKVQKERASTLYEAWRKVSDDNSAFDKKIARSFDELDDADQERFIERINNLYKDFCTTD